MDADVAIVDTGIAYHPDLNVAGGYNCSTTDPTAWRDKNHHGTHVAGTVAALDNGIGVVGVAPGARVWGVKILNDDGYGLISWYICGLDWILAQRDPTDASRPLFEAVNMSVTKPGSDDGNCGLTNNDPLHQAICRVVAGGITVVAAAANDHHNAAANIPASYNEVITVSALADTDGKAGGLGGNACYSWGGYDKDDTFADFSNYGADVDIMAPGKCILSTVPGGYGTLSGTSMAAPTVTGAVALYKESRPNATPAEVREALRYLGNLNWKISTDPDPTHEPLLDVSRIHDLGTFDFAPTPTTAQRAEAGTTASIPVNLVRSATFFERVQISITSLPDGWSGAPLEPARLDRQQRSPVGHGAGGHAPRARTRSPSRPRTRAAPRRRPSRSTSSWTIRPPARRSPGWRPTSRWARRRCRSASLAGRDGSDERDRRLRGCIERERRPVERRDLDIGERGALCPSVRRALPLPGPDGRRRRPLEPVGRERQPDHHPPGRRPQLVDRAFRALVTDLELERLPDDADRLGHRRSGTQPSVHGHRHRARRPEERTAGRGPRLHRWPVRLLDQHEDGPVDPSPGRLQVRLPGGGYAHDHRPRGGHDQVPGVPARRVRRREVGACNASACASALS